MASDLTPIRYGLVGAGNFGTFCIEQFRRSPLIDVRAVADENADLARRTAGAFGVDAHGSADELLARADVDLVHLATPPFTHKALVLRALTAGKHVLCEKPLATTVDDASEMIAAAAAARRVLVVNLIMRYDPLNRAVARVLEGRLLGEPIFASLVNLAGDWKLSPRHWFWDPSKSGGIFVEHSVHFFDLFAMFFDGAGGPPAGVLSATSLARPGNDAIVDQVACVARHASGVLATQYHGFHQPGALDRQELRIVCERGELRLFDWLTTRVSVDAIVDQAAADQIAASFPHPPAVVQLPLKPDAPGLDAHVIRARHKAYRADARYQMEATLNGAEKQSLYGDAVRALLEDQVRFIRDPAHPRQVTEANGLASLAMADAARRLATSAEVRR